jgi:chemotaxis protein MotC
MKKTVAIAAFIVSGLQASLAGDRLSASIATLEILQDRMAQGDAGAEKQQSRLIAQIETDILNGSPRVPGDRRTLEALAIFLFSGGNPGIVEKRLQNSDTDIEETHLIKGALAYVRADRQQALKELSGLDASELPATVGGRVALVRAILLASSDIPKAMADLDAARRLMPGTLVEEAALRRCVAFAGVQKDAARLQNCGQRYMRRFHASIYWKDFAEGLVKSTILLAGSFPDFSNMIEPLPSERRRMLTLEVARAAVMAGALALARISAEHARTLSRAESVDMDRASLYSAAADVADADASAVFDRVDKINETRLSNEDAKLLAELRKVRSEIEREPDISLQEALRIVPPAERTTEDSAKP